MREGSHLFLIYLIVHFVNPKFIYALDAVTNRNDFTSSSNNLIGLEPSLNSLVKETKASDVDNSLTHKPKDKISDSDRLTRVEEEIERLKHNFLLLQTNDKHKKKEMDEILLSATKEESGKSKQEDSNVKNEIDEIKGRLVRIETTVFNREEDLIIPNNHRPRRAVSPSTPPPCNFRANCAFDLKNNGNEENKSNPPTSCGDLLKIGHTLNGYYPIKIGTKKVGLVYCNFNLNGNVLASSSTLNKGLETMIGNIDIKTRSVQFFVQRKTDFKGSDIIPFEIERLNLGGAMDVTTGVFTAPVAGIYNFQFSSSKDDHPGYLEVVLQVNGNKISYSAAGLWGTNENKNVRFLPTIHVSLSLKMGDRVNVAKYGPAGISDANGYHVTHFTGSLLEEDLELA